MKIDCPYWRECGLGELRGCCSIDAYSNPTAGVCLKLCKKYAGVNRDILLAQLAKLLERKHGTLGGIIRIIIHFALDCVDAFIRRRNRYKLVFVEIIKSCCGCKEREVKIDIYSAQFMAKLHSCFKLGVA